MLLVFAAAHFCCHITDQSLCCFAHPDHTCLHYLLLAHVVAITPIRLLLFFFFCCLLYLSLIAHCATTAILTIGCHCATMGLLLPCHLLWLVAPRWGDCRLLLLCLLSQLVAPVLSEPLLLLQSTLLPVHQCHLLLLVAIAIATSCLLLLRLLTPLAALVPKLQMFILTLLPQLIVANNDFVESCSCCHGMRHWCHQ